MVVGSNLVFGNIELHVLGALPEIYLFIWDFNVAFNSVQVISGRVVLWAEETSTYSWSRFCTVNCRPPVNNYQLFHMSVGVTLGNERESNIPQLCSLSEVN